MSDLYPLVETFHDKIPLLFDIGWPSRSSPSTFSLRSNDLVNLFGVNLPSLHLLLPPEPIVKWFEVARCAVADLHDLTEIWNRTVSAFAYTGLESPSGYLLEGPWEFAHM